MPSLVNLLKDVDVQALSLVPTGANGQRIFLFKCDGFSCPAGANELPSGEIIKADDWSAFYIVVAEPGLEEKPGLYGDQTTTDVWADEDEIRKAAHRFMRNGALVNKLHEDMQPYGQLVENAVAHSDFTVPTPSGPHTVRKGSWYVAIAPTDEGRAAIENGELGGVSIQGTGSRVAKGALERVPGVQNWIERLPAPMRAAWNASIVYRAAVHIAPKMGSVGHAIASALNWADHICHTGDVKQWPGPQEVRPSSVAECCEAIALWESMKATAHSQSMSKSDEPPWAEVERLRSDPGMIEPMEKEGLSLLQRVAKSLGIEPVEKCDLVEGCECLSFEVDDGAPDDAPVDLAKAKLTAAGRKQLPKTAFAVPAKAPGSGSFPIHDRAHAIAALARSKGKPQEATVHSQVCKRFPDLPACQSVAKGEGLREDGGTVEAPVELSERVEKLEEGQEKITEQVTALTADDSPLMKGIQDLKIRFEEKASDEEKKADEQKAADEQPTPESVEKKLDEVADGQELLAKTLLDLSEQVGQMAERGGTRQVDQAEPVAKQNAHPLAGLLS